MIKKNIKKLILTSLVILLPMALGLIFWEQLPGTFTSHWNINGEADGTAGKAFTVIGLPLILLAFHWLCVAVTAADPKNKGQNNKIFGIVLWIIPTLSILMFGIMYSLALGVELDMEKLMLAAIALMFLVLGNYLPKCKQNSTIGIKLPWTLADEENWNKTHRMGGRLWVTGGAILLITAFLRSKLIPFVLLTVIAVLVVVPTVYSYALFKKSGRKLYKSPKSIRNTVISAIAVTIILGAAMVLMFTGNVNVSWGEESFTVKATYWENIEISYDSVDSVEYRESFDGGSRTNGFGSARLLLGTFKNDEFGYYTRYTYTGGNFCVILSIDGKILVLGGADKESTREIYENIREKTE